MASILSWILSILILTIALAGGYFAYVTRRIAREAERRVPAVGKFIDAAGERIHYVEQGEGPPILFVHGLGGQLHHFRHTLFPAMGEGYRLIAVDRPGSGYSTRRASGPRITEQAAVLAAVIDTLSLDRPLVVGHSLGGAIALALALDYPGKVGGLALLSPLTRPVEGPPPAEFAGLAIRSPFLRWVVSRTIAVPMSLRHAQQTLDFVFGPQKPPIDYPVGGGGLLGLRPPQFQAVSSDFMAIPSDLGDYARRYGELRVPVSILYGDRDRVLDHRFHGTGLIALHPAFEIEMEEGVGHMPQYAAPAIAAEFVRRAAQRITRP